MPRDTNALAHMVTAMATGETPPEPVSTKNPAAVALGRLGGLKGGRARAASLTNAFSKKVENHCAAVALHFMHYNFCRIHQTLRVTPAMAAGVTDHVWEIGEIVDLLG